MAPTNFATLAELLNTQGRFSDGQMMLGQALLEYLFAPHSRAWCLACWSYAHGGPGLEADPLLHELVGLLPPYQQKVAMLHVWCAERLRTNPGPGHQDLEEVLRKAEETGLPAGLILDLLAELGAPTEPRSIGPHLLGTLRPLVRKQPMTALLAEPEAFPGSSQWMGVVAAVVLELVPSEPGELYPSTELAFVERDATFLQAEAHAAEVLRKRQLWPAGYAVRWHLSRWDEKPLPLSLAGGSLGACLTLGMMKLVAEDHPQLEPLARLAFTGTAITAGIEPDGTLVPVEAQAIKLDAAAACRACAQVYTVIVAEPQAVEYLGLAPHARRPHVYCAPHVDFHVLAAKTVDKAITLLADDLSTRWCGIDCELPPRDPAFVGRERLFATLESFIREHDAGYVLLVAEMGKGKSSAMVELIHRLREAGETPIYHFVNSRSSLTSDPERIAACFYDRLRHKHRIAEPPSWVGLSSPQRLEQVLQLVSRKVRAEGGKEILFLEAADQLELPVGSSLIPAYLCQLPPGVFCVVSVRPNGRTLLSGDGVTVLNLEEYVDDAADIRHYLEQQAATVEPPLSQELIEAIMSAGVKPVFFTVAACLRELRNPATEPARREELRRGPNEWISAPEDLIERELQRRLQQAMMEGISEGEFWTTLGLTAVACESLSRGGLMSLGLLRPPHRLRVLALCDNLFHVPPAGSSVDRTYDFPHPGYVRAVLNQSRGAFVPYCHELLADGCRDAWRNPDHPAHRYALAHWLTHLLEGRCWRELALALTNLEYLQKALTAPAPPANSSTHTPAAPPLSVFDLVAAFHHALPKLEAEAPEHMPAVQALAGVVIRHAHALKRDPRLLAQVAYNELVFAWSDATPLGRQIRAAAERCPMPWLKRLNAPRQATSPALVSQFWDHKGPVTCLAFARHRPLLASGSRDGTVRVWNARTGRCEHEFSAAANADPGRWVVGVAFLPEDDGLVSATREGIISLWRLNTHSPKRTVYRQAEAEILCLALSPDGRWVATGSSDCKVRLWDLASGRLLRIFCGHRAAVSALAFSPDGQDLASGADDYLIHVWRLRRPGQVTMRQESWVHALAYSPDGRTLVSGGGVDSGWLRFWDPENGQGLRALSGHTGGVRCVDFSPDGRRVASGSYDCTVLVRDPGTGLSLPPLGSAHPINALAFSPDGQFLATASDDRVVRLWDVRGTPNRYPAEASAHGHDSFEGSVLYAMVFSQDGQVAISGGCRQPTRAWSTDDGRRLGAFEGHHHDVTSVAISRDRRRVASGSLRRVCLWSHELARLENILQGHEGYVLAVAFSPDGRRVLTGAEDCKVMVWDADKGCWILTLIGHQAKIRAVAFSPDGRWIASGAEEPIVRVWDAHTGKLLHHLEGHQGHVPVLAFFEPMPWLVSGGTDETLCLWNAETGQLLRTIPAPGESISALAVAPTGRLLAAGCEESTVRVWDTASGALLASMDCADKVLALSFDPPSPAKAAEEAPLILRVADAGGGSHIPNFYVMQLMGLPRAGAS